MNTDDAKNEAPLSWTAEDVWGSVGRTHYATAELDNGDTWKFTVDQPSKGHWVARGWRNGDMKFYREDRTMKGAKAQSQAHANLAATSTCTECRHIGGHLSYCPAVTRAVDAFVARPRLPESQRRYVDPFGVPAKPAPQQASSQDCTFLPGEATPACDFDPNCPAHDERCLGCGEPKNNGQVHGLNQGYGGCV